MNKDKDLITEKLKEIGSELALKNRERVKKEYDEKTLKK